MSDSPERTTLLNCHVHLVQFISRAPKDIADRLKAFLSPEDERFIAHRMEEDSDRARRIISAVNTRVDLALKAEKKARIFKEFMEALKSTGPWINDLVETLEEEYSSLTGTPTPNADEGDTKPKSSVLKPRLDMPPLSIESLVEHNNGLTEDKLNTTIEDRHLHFLADYFDSIDGYLDKLELSPGKQTDIKELCYRRSTQAAMVEALKQWRNPNPFGATYRRLLEVVLEMGKGYIATKMAKYIAEKV